MHKQCLQAGTGKPRQCVFKRVKVCVCAAVVGRGGMLYKPRHVCRAVEG